MVIFDDTHTASRLNASRQGQLDAGDSGWAGTQVARSAMPRAVVLAG